MHFLTLPLKIEKGGHFRDDQGHIQLQNALRFFLSGLDQKIGVRKWPWEILRPWTAKKFFQVLKNLTSRVKITSRVKLRL